MDQEELFAAARNFDAQLSKLASLLQGSDLDLEADKMVAAQVLGSISDSCRQISIHLDGIEAAQLAAPSARQLLTSLKRMVGLERNLNGGGSTPTTTYSSSLQGTPRHHQAGTPSSLSRPTKKERISTPSRNVDFDAFPSTPTLDQLGLSGHAMAVVGDQTMMGLDSENTDTEHQMDQIANRTFASSSSVHMSSPRSSAANSNWNHLSTPPSERLPGLLYRPQKQNESSPFPYPSPLAQSTTGHGDLV